MSVKINLRVDWDTVGKKRRRTRSKTLLWLQWIVLLLTLFLLFVEALKGIEIRAGFDGRIGQEAPGGYQASPQSELRGGSGTD